MMNVNIITVGKLKEKYLTDACAEYIKRLSVFCNLKIYEVNESRLPDKPSEKDIERCLKTESADIQKLAKGFIVPMCIEGKMLSSEELSAKFDDIAVSGISTVSFIIGSSFGISQEIKNSADLKLSMSKMTFPHQLARVMLLEQIYRAFQISTGGKYHK